MQELQKDPKQDKAVKLTALAEITASWSVADREALLSMDGLHIWSRQFIEDRLAWRSKVPFTLLQLRVRRLKEDIMLKNKDSYWGCFSFVDVPCDLSIAELREASEPALPDPEFRRIQEQLHAVLHRFPTVVALEI